jgi:hypothetical protein
VLKHKRPTEKQLTLRLAVEDVEKFLLDRRIQVR